MAKLPTVEAFGARPTPTSGRGITVIQGGIAQDATARAAGEVNRVAGNLYEKYAQEDAEREARDLTTEYSKRLLVLQEGDGTPANPGYKNLRGQAAIDAREAHTAALEKAREEVLAKASGSRVTKIIGSAFDARHRSALTNSVIHFGNQRRFANEQSRLAYRGAIMDEAAVAGKDGDTAQVVFLSKLLAAQEEAWAKETGKDPTLMAEAARSGILVAEIERSAAVDADVARVFFEKNKALIDGRLHAGIEK
ncbi:MAG TPA: hypothetical protein VNA25_00960, partial [Phycisphaerae bacterium]|nr:hypothetical protein [Phycisphaerae bacterium]